METTATTLERRVRVIPATKAPETLRKAQDGKNACSGILPRLHRQ